MTKNATATPIQDIVRAVFPFAYSVVSDGADAAMPVWLDQLPFRVHEFPSGVELNGWTIGPSWRVLKAEIRKDGALIYDGTQSPLGVITQSTDFSGRVSLETLKQHLFTSDEIPEAIPYHWTALYRPFEEDWGFCMPRTLFDALAPGNYDVEIATERRAGTMKVYDYILPGALPETVLLNGHNCHPFQANDDLSGCAVGIEVMRRLAATPNRRLSYRLIVAPELFGTMMWLNALGEEARHLVAGVMLKSVGNGEPLKLQHSFTGNAAIDRAARLVFTERFRDFVSGAFRTIHGNDETVFEAPGYEIPSIALTRVPFREYHTDHDTPDSLSETMLQETTEVAYQICMALDRDRRMNSKFKGLICLSNPKYNLYKPAPAPNIDRECDKTLLMRWNVLMNALPRYLDEKTTILEIAERHQVPIKELYDYVLLWEQKGLLKFVD